MLTNFLTAFQFLTILRLKKSLPGDKAALGQSATFFPIVGLFIGALVWGIDWLLHATFPPILLSLGLVGLLAAISRGFQLFGLANCVDALVGGADSQHHTALQKNSMLGAFGILALICVLALKVYALNLLYGGYRDLAIFLSPMLGRWACVVMAYSSRPARNGGVGAILVQGVEFNEFALASLIALGVLFTLIEIVGIALVIPLGGLIIGFTLYCNLRLGGVAEDHLGAVGELIETTALGLFLLLAQGGTVPTST